MSVLWEDLHPSIYRRRGRQPQGVARPKRCPHLSPHHVGGHSTHKNKGSPIIPIKLIILHSKFQEVLILKHTFNWVDLMVVIQWTLHSMNTSFNEQSLTLSPLYYFDIPKLFWQFIKTVPALSSIFSGVPYPLKTRRQTLSVSPYGSWIMWTWSRHISDQ